MLEPGNLHAVSRAIRDMQGATENGSRINSRAQQGFKVTPDQDPIGVISSKFLPYLAGVVLAVSLAVWRLLAGRSLKQKDDFELRLRVLEADHVSRKELKLELKELELQIIQNNKDQAQKLDDIYKLLLNMKGDK